MALVGADGAVGAVPDDAVASADAFIVRQRQVRAAVETLARALGPHGATYLRNVQKWEGALVPAAPKLAAFPQPLTQAGHRLPATPPAPPPRRAVDMPVVAIQARETMPPLRITLLTELFHAYMNPIMRTRGRAVAAGRLPVLPPEDSAAPLLARFKEGSNSELF